MVTSTPRCTRKSRRRVGCAHQPRSRSASHLPRIIGPVQQGLSLPWTASQIAAAAVLFELRDVPADGSPAADLALVVRAAAAQIVAAIPLEPAAGVLVIDPALGS